MRASQKIAFPATIKSLLFLGCGLFSTKTHVLPAAALSGAIFTLWFYGDFFRGVEDGLFFRRPCLIVIDFPMTLTPSRYPWPYKFLASSIASSLSE